MNLLHVRILNSKEVLFDGQALSVSSKNSAGKFDVLPEHANFITLLENTDVVVRGQNASPLKFHFKQAILYTSKDQVSIYGDISI